MIAERAEARLPKAGAPLRSAGRRAGLDMCDPRHCSGRRIRV